MERFTEKDESGNYLQGDIIYGNWGNPEKFYGEAVDRLAAYEDFMERWNLSSIEDADRVFQRVNALGGTDLMAQYRDLGPIGHLRDLIQAEKDGRLKIVKKPPAGAHCGNCTDFVRDPGRASGQCRTQHRKRGGRHDEMRRVSQSTKACAAFSPCEEAEAALKGGGKG